MSAAEWAQQIEELQRKPPFPGVAVLVPHKARELAALLRRAERVEEAARVVAVPEPGCPCPGCAALIVLREALEG